MPGTTLAAPEQVLSLKRNYCSTGQTTLYNFTQPCSLPLRVPRRCFLPVSISCWMAQPSCLQWSFASLSAPLFQGSCLVLGLCPFKEMKPGSSGYDVEILLKSRQVLLSLWWLCFICKQHTHREPFLTYQRGEVQELIDQHQWDLWHHLTKVFQDGICKGLHRFLFLHIGFLFLKQELRDTEWWSHGWKAHRFSPDGLGNSDQGPEGLQAGIVAFMYLVFVKTTSWKSHCPNPLILQMKG